MEQEIAKDILKNTKIIQYIGEKDKSEGNKRSENRLKKFHIQRQTDQYIFLN